MTTLRWRPSSPPSHATKACGPRGRQSPRLFDTRTPPAEQQPQIIEVRLTVVVDIEDMLIGFDTLQSLASAPELIIPGHDPLVRDYFPSELDDFIHRLDAGPSNELKL